MPRMSPDELKAVDDPFLKLAGTLYPEYLRLRELDKRRMGSSINCMDDFWR